MQQPPNLREPSVSGPQEESILDGRRNGSPVDGVDELASPLTSHNMDDTGVQEAGQSERRAAFSTESAVGTDSATNVGREGKMNRRMAAWSLRHSHREPQETERLVKIGDPEQTAKEAHHRGQGALALNGIRTSKYTPLTFLPRNLFEQFHRFAYIYFLIIVVLNQVPVLAVFGRTASLFPLLVVLIVTALKDGYEDWARHRADREENGRLSPVLNASTLNFLPKRWAEIAVGDVVKLCNNEAVPCDLVLLASSNEGGRAFIETMNLDGETNLKTRVARPETAAVPPEEGAVQGIVVCEGPNRNIHEFSGYLELDSAGGQSQVEGGVSSANRLPLGPSNVVLRGSEVRNTAWVLGCCIYAGPDTKAMLNSSGAQSKRSRLERLLNRDTLLLAALLVVLCLVGAIGMGLWIGGNDVHSLPYYGASHNYHGALGEAALNWFSCLIVFQIMVPISLYISMELVRLGQSYFMTRDTHMAHTPSGRRFQVRALNINEDLGQVAHVFSDKTGTLTENRMEFHAASILGIDYSNQELLLRSVEDASPAMPSPQDEDDPLLKGLKLPWKPKAGARVDGALVLALQGADINNSRMRSATGEEPWNGLHNFFLTLAICNTVVPTKISRSVKGELDMHAARAEEAGWVEYHGESPDEQALVQAAAGYGYSLLERSAQSVVLSVLGTIERYDVLGLHEFDSDRKCMSLVVRCPDGATKLLAKGADSVMLGLCKKPNHLPSQSSLDGRGNGWVGQQGELSQEQITHEGTLRDLDSYAREGLRTLVIAWRQLSQAEEATWVGKYQIASSAIGGRAEKLAAVARSVEHSLTLLGATGIEDRLQAGVPETISILRQAGIKVWVLTGDKQETAISIAHSCQLVTHQMRLLTVNATSQESTAASLADARRHVAKQQNALPRHRKSLAAWPALFFRPSLLFQRIVTLIRGDVFGTTLATSAAPMEPVGCLGSTSWPNRYNGENTHAFEGLPKEEGHEAGQEGSPSPLAMVIDGGTLVHAMSGNLEDELYKVASACEAVICCRVAPLQKASVVGLVKRRTDALTLAIGDGANDVSMIQMAHVGVGISGQEGRQAVMASDYAIAQFRFLGRLLLVHGHWNYQRLAYMVLYNFYKNAVFVFMLFWFILYTAFSPQTGISDWSLVFYSLIYTSVPTIVVGILEQDVLAPTLMRLPPLYGSGLRNEVYNGRLFWLTIVDTVWQSLVLFYVPFFTARGSDASLWATGQVWTIGVVLVVLGHLAMDIRHWTWLHHLSIWGSLVLTVIFLLILDVVDSPQYFSLLHAAGTAHYWLDLLLIVALALGPRFIIKFAVQRWAPSDTQIALEAERLGILSTWPQEAGERAEVAEQAGAAEAHHADMAPQHQVAPA